MILITGGAGYIGAHVNKMLYENGYNTLIVDNLISGHRELAKWGTFEIADLADIQKIRDIFYKYHISAVVHLAGSAYVNESVCNPEKYYLNNVRNTLQLLQVMLESHVNKIIFSSSCATYGIPSSIPITETHHQYPISPYGRSKLIVESVLKDYSKAYDLRYICLRYFNAVGADSHAQIGEWHEPETHLLPLVLDVALGKRRCVNIFGVDYDTPDGTCIRDYVHVNDLAAGHLLALEYLLKNGDSDTFNLGTGIGNSTKEIIENVAIITKQAISYEENERRAGDPPVLICDPSKAKTTLGWRPKNSNLHDIIATAWRWHKKCYSSQQC